MRGSPVIHAVLLGLALLGVASLMLRVTATQAPEVRPPPALGKAPDHIVARYELSLSAEVERIRVTAADDKPGESPSGSLQIMPEHAVLAVRVKWTKAPEPGVTRFAKLRLEVPGKETFHHVFEAAGDIDDVVEVPEQLLK